MNSKLQNILIVGPAWVGDMVMAQTLFRVLREKHPNAHIDVLAPQSTRAILERMPEVREIIPLPFAHGEFAFWARRRLGKTLRAKHYDQAIVLPNSWKSALIPFFARIPHRTGYLGEARYGLLNDARRLQKATYPLMIERFMALGVAKSAPIPTPYPLPKLIVHEADRAATLKRFGLGIGESPVLSEVGGYSADTLKASVLALQKASLPFEGLQNSPQPQVIQGKCTAEKVIALCPGAAFGPSKRWPVEHFAELANTLLDEGHQVWLFGASEDMALTAEIQKATDDRCQDFAGRSSLVEAIDLLSCAHQVVTNDSGLMHIAAALDRPLIALYGSSSPSFTPPLTKKADIIKLDLPCQPCFQRTCPLKHFRCMRDLTPTMVLHYIQKDHTHARSHS